MISIDGNTNGSIDFCAGRSANLGGVDCPESNQQGLDLEYPYEDGKIGKNGFSVVDQTLHRADTEYSSMSFCDPSWISDYEWNKLLTWFEQ